MPRVYSHKARKDYPQFGIAKGDTYYEWTKRPGGRGKGVTYKSKTRPTRAQLTSSGFLSTVYGIFDQEFGEPGDFEQAASDLREAGEECQSSLDNMPESLQYAPSGEMLQTRIDSCEEAADELERIGQELAERLEEIENLEKEWEDYNTALAEWVESRPDGTDDDPDACQPEDVDDETWQAWVDSRPEEPAEPEEDWDEKRREALEAAREEVNEPDWG